MMSRTVRAPWNSISRAAVVVLAVTLLPVSALAQPAPATFTVLYAFQGGSDGAYPGGKLLVDAAGNVYGTTVDGGDRYGFGTVYKVDPAGNEFILHEFSGKNDGGYGSPGLVQDAAGNLYGATSAGGKSSCGGRGCGTVFKLDPTGKETVLYNFTGEDDGASPNGNLILDGAGNLYGTAYWAPYGYGGAVFKVDQSGNETVLHEFSGLPDGEFPIGGLWRDQHGNLFGTTSGGGGGACLAEGCGTVFKVNRKGKEIILYRFLGSPDGAAPFAGVIADSTGWLYGTTYNGGDPHCTDRGPGCGTVFKVNASGKEKVLYRFRNKKNERFPFSGLVQDAGGNLYGTTAGGDSAGTVFKLDPSGNETVLYRFTGGVDGCGPAGSLTFDSADNLYGAARGCGAHGYGVIFKITP